MGVWGGFGGEGGEVGKGGAGCPFVSACVCGNGDTGVGAGTGFDILSGMLGTWPSVGGYLALCFAAIADYYERAMLNGVIGIQRKPHTHPEGHEMHEMHAGDEGHDWRHLRRGLVKAESGDQQVCGV
jgi:hypothetical protein